MHLWSMSTFIIFPIYHQPYHLDLYTLAHPAAIPPTCTVGWHAELATPGEAGFEGAALALRDQLLHGEKEGHLGTAAADMGRWSLK